MKTPLITLTSDFGLQTQGIAMMKGIIFKICPKARVIDLMHGISDFSIVTGARTMETVAFMPIGYHVCVVDPGVGTKRKGIIIKTGRGDYLIGPDNGVLIPATRFIGGIKKIVAIENEKYMNKPVSPVFHGRDIFAPAAAHLANGVKLGEFGQEIKNIARAPYEEAKVGGNKIKAKIIHINKFGSIHLNIMHKEFGNLKLRKGDIVNLEFKNKKIKIPFMDTFGDVKQGEFVIFKDDYGRIEIAINMERFIEKFPVKLMDDITIKL